MLVQGAIRPKARTDIDAEWSDLPDRLSNVVGSQTSGKKHWTVDFGHDPSAEGPVVHSTGSAQFAKRSVRAA